MDEKHGNEYAWLGDFERTWEALEEDESGSIEQSMASIIHKAKRRQMINLRGGLQMGMMRHLFVIIDGSAAMLSHDMRPDLFQCTIKMVENFVKEFMDENPIAQLGLMLLRNKRCSSLSDLSGNTKNHLKCLAELKKTFCEGDASLYNAMDQAHKTLKHLPGHTSREILIIFGNVTTVDPHDIDNLLKDLKLSGVKCSIIGLSAHIYACQKICRETNGKYDVAADETHFESLLRGHLLPPVSPENQDSSLIKIGFPELNCQTDIKLSNCQCHLDSLDPRDCFGKSGYLCPQCSSKYCDLPIECTVCGLMLASSSHLSRSYHHLFPLMAFEEVSVQNVGDKNRICYACQFISKELSVYRCTKCNKHFCSRCDILMHESLHSCPGCTSVGMTTSS